MLLDIYLVHQIICVSLPFPETPGLRWRGPVGRPPPHSNNLWPMADICVFFNPRAGIKLVLKMINYVQTLLL